MSFLEHHVSILVYIPKNNLLGHGCFTAMLCHGRVGAPSVQTFHKEVKLFLWFLNVPGPETVSSKLLVSKTKYYRSADLKDWNLFSHNHGRLEVEDQGWIPVISLSCLTDDHYYTLNVIPKAHFEIWCPFWLAATHLHAKQDVFSSTHNNTALGILKCFPW